MCEMTLIYRGLKTTHGSILLKPFPLAMSQLSKNKQCLPCIYNMNILLCILLENS